MTTVYWCRGCGTETTGSGGVCPSCGTELTLAPMPELVQTDEAEVGFELIDWSPAERADLVAWLVASRIRHRMDDDSVTVGVADESTGAFDRRAPGTAPAVPTEGRRGEQDERKHALAGRIGLRISREVELRPTALTAASRLPARTACQASPSPFQEPQKEGDSESQSRGLAVARHPPSE